MTPPRPKTDRDGRRASGNRSPGSVPYGYRVVDALYDSRGNCLHPGVVVVEEREYAIVEEIFQRVPFETVGRLVDGLNARAIPSPFVSRGVNTPRPVGASGAPRPYSGKWSRPSLTNIVTNPWYAGYIARRTETDPEQGLVRLPRDRWILSEEPGDWPCPLTLGEWEEIQELLPSRRRGRSRIGLLTGILYCCQGRALRRSGSSSYACDCRERGEPHSGWTADRARFEAFIQRLVTDTLFGPDRVELPALTTPAAPESGGPRPRTELYAELARRQSEIAARTRTLDDPEVAPADRTRQTLEISELRARAAALREELRRPDPDETARLLQSVSRFRGLDPDTLWEEKPGWTRREMRRLVQTVIARIDLPAKPAKGGYYREAHITFQPGFTEVTPPPLPKRQRRQDDKMKG